MMNDPRSESNEPILRIGRLSDGDRADHDDWAGTTAVERLEAMWPLALAAWAFQEGFDAQQRLPRHIVSFRKLGD